MVLNFELIRIAVALIGTSAAAYQDYKTSYIDDKIVYAMMAVGILLNVLTNDIEFLLFSLGGAAVIGVIGYFIYKEGQFGAGDVLLFTGLQLLLPYAPVSTVQLIGLIPLLADAGFLNITRVFPFIFSIFIASALLALVISSAKYALELRVKKVKWKPERISIFVLSFLSLLFLFWFNSVYALSVMQVILFLVVMAASVFSTSMKEQIMKELIIQKVPLNEIESEDIIATETMPPKLVKIYSIERVFTTENKAKMRKLSREKKINLFPVYKDLPRFAPYILIALILSLLFISPLAYILFI